MIRKLAPVLVALALYPTQVTQGQELARKVFDSATEDAAMPTVSPDGKWLVYIRFISNQESQVVIRPLDGGESRVLQAGKAVYYAPRFTPQGDRLLVVSNLVRRDASDDATYLVSAPFETGTGTLTGAFRQVALDPVRMGAAVGHYSVSPDGRSVAFFSTTGNTIRVVPMAGGNSKVLADPTAGRASSLAWSTDGRAVFYNLRIGPDSALRVRAPLDGSASQVVATSRTGNSMLLPDNRYAFTVDRVGRNTTLRIFTADGRLLGELPTTGWRFEPVVGGKYLVSMMGNAVAPIKIVPVGGGPIRQLTEGNSYDWPDGWSTDGTALWVGITPNSGTEADSVRYQWIAKTLDGQTKHQLRLPAGTTAIAQDDEYFVYATLPPRFPDMRIMRVSLKDGSRKQLTGPVMQGCRPVAAGGMYYGTTGGEFYYGQTVGNRMQFRGMTIGGTSRLIADVPAFRCEDEASVFHDRLVFVARTDSARVQMTTGPGTAPRTLAAFGPAERFAVLAWSKDGRQLAIGAGDQKQRLLIYQFDETGTPRGSPRSLTLPFEYWYEAFWLADGSGFTMIAQPRGAATTEVAVVKLADPEHPVLLTRDDPNNIWGQSLSPDGKFVAYPSEQLKGSSVYLTEVAELLKRVGATK